MSCPWCGSSNVKFVETKNSVHYGKEYCGDCDKWIRWISNPDSIRKKNPNRIMKLSPERVCKFHNFKTIHCFFCQRIKEQLGWNETLTVDHIEELDKGGKDKIENQQVLCSACHKLKNWTRLYMNWHLNKEEDEDDTKTNREV